MENDLILGGGGGIPNLQKPKLDPTSMKTVHCKHCNGILFVPKIVLKQVPGTLVGYGGEDVQVPINVLVCDNCGKIIDDDVKTYKLENDVESDKIIQ